MAYFIKAAEVWQPDLQGQHLVLASSSYGANQDEALKAFQDASEHTRFAINEGLPGKTWVARRPLIWTDLNTTHFKRKDIAKISGLVCGLSIPVFAGEFLLGIVVLFFAEDDANSAAVEVWQNRDYYDNELRLADGYYGKLEKFEFISRRLTIMRGRGLPGCAWAEAMPIIETNLAESSSFLRATNAAESGITTGLAIPFFYTDRDVQIVAFLSTETTPVARRFEVWTPDESRLYLLYQSGFCAEGTDLKTNYRGAAFDRGESTLGRVWFTGRPEVEISAENGQRHVYIPFIVKGILQAIVRMSF